MPEAEGLPPDFRHVRLLQDLHAYFLEVAIGPYVMVPREEVHLHAGVHQIRQCAEDAHGAFRDHVPIFIPEVPDVTQQVQRLRPGRRNAPQEGDEPRLAVRRVLNLEAQVDVGSEVCEISRQARNDRLRKDED